MGGIAVLRIESVTGMIFAIDLAEVFSILYSSGVVRFRTVYGYEVTLGGPEWGGIVSVEDINSILDQWEDAREGPFEEPEVSDATPLPPSLPSSLPSPGAPKPPERGVRKRWLNRKEFRGKGSG